MFIDKAKVFIKSGDGGRGALSFKREKGIPFGGPDGGNGGRGGDIYIQGSFHKQSLEYYHHQKHFFASSGSAGENQNCTGKCAEPLYLVVPIGTEVYLENNNVTLDVVDEEPILLLKGGRGGTGNGSLKTSTNRAPNYTKPLEKGEEDTLHLTLKTAAHVGLVGYPNAGKSSFLNSFTNAESRVEPFPFSTIHPVLGTYKNIKFIDVPGLIEDSHKGRGMGIKFLQHIERCKILLLVTDIHDNPQEKTKIILQELKEYGIQKQIIILLNKVDLIDKQELNHMIYKLKKQTPYRIFFCSTKHNYGIKYIINHIEKILK